MSNIRRLSKHTLNLDVYGLTIRIESEWGEVVDALALDFDWFTASENSARVEISIERRPPDFDRFGDAHAAFITPRNVVYEDAGRSIIDYFGRVVSIYDRDADRLRVEGDDQQLVHEAAYQFVLSRAGEYLDRQKLPRLHGLALAGSQGAVAVILPSGGGKTTLALRAMREPGVKLLSEDSPLIDRRGFLHPFPLRIGVNETDLVDSFQDTELRRIERMEFHPKVALELSTFEDRIEARPQPLRHLVLGRRSLGREGRLEPIPRRAAVGTLLREGVVGVGIYQGMEFVLQRGARDVLRKADIAMIRAFCCGAGLARARVWRLTLGRDHDSNWAALRMLLA